MKEKEKIKMKVNVSSQLTYLYEVEIPDDEEFKQENNLLDYVDSKDPVFNDLCRIVNRADLIYEARDISIINDETEEILYAE
jgi:hypothetical protein